MKLFFELLPTIVCIAVLAIFIFLFNACTASDWNDGECPDCHEEYELVGVTSYSKFYYCDRCGKEVQRMW